MLLLTRLFFATALLTLMLIIKSWQLPFITSIKYRIFDMYQTLAPRTYQPALVRIVDLDEESLGRLGQWPWPRTRVAELVQKLHDAGAASIAFDIVFAEPDRTSPNEILKVWGTTSELQTALSQIPDGDDALAATLNGRATVTSFVLTHDAKKAAPALKAGFALVGGTPAVPAFTGAVVSLPELEKTAAGNGAMNSDPDDDGILRRVPLVLRLGDQLYPSLAAEAMRVAQGASSYTVKTISPTDGDSRPQPVTAFRIGNITIPTDAEGRMWVYYTPYVAERYVPAWKILDGSFDPQSIAGHIVLIGTSAEGLKDVRTTPLNPVAPGIEVHAQAIEQALLGVAFSRPDWINGAEIIAIILAGVITILAAARLPALAGGMVLVLMVGAAFGISFHLFTSYKILAEPVIAVCTMLLGYFNESLSRSTRIERERSQIRNAFSHYMAPDLVEDLAQHPDKLTLGGEMRELTVMFSDMRGFTAISEQLSPEALTTLLNRFLTPMTDIILSEKGTIDKYIGDCIMAFWNAPVDVADHPAHAARAALKMLDAVHALNGVRQREAETAQQPFLPIRIGIGINTGECCVGNMGSDQRFSYSALGDEVNLASRLEGQCKTYGLDIVLGQSTAQALSNFALLEIDKLRVHGKTETLHIYTLLGDETLAQDSYFKTLAVRHRTMLNAYRSREWETAWHAIAQCRETLAAMPSAASTLEPLYAMYEKRIADFHTTPPPENWDATFEALSK